MDFSYPDGTGRRSGRFDPQPHDSSAYPPLSQRRWLPSEDEEDELGQPVKQRVSRNRYPWVAPSF